MTGTGWELIGFGAFVAAAIVVAIVAVYRFGPGRTRVLMRSAARRLGGRLDPATSGARIPAVLVELDGVLLRAAPWPIDGPSGRTPYLELCTPVEGVGARVLVVRRVECRRLADLVGEDARLPTAASSSSGSTVCSSHAAAWAGPTFARHGAWALLELDARMLRVLACDPGARRLGVAQVEAAVRDFAAAVPALLEAAGVTNSERH